jgi:hypothetical protein
MDGIEFDERRWPILVVTFTGDHSEKTTEQFMRGMEGYYGRREPFAMIVKIDSYRVEDVRLIKRVAKWYMEHRVRGVRVRPRDRASLGVLPLRPLHLHGARPHPGSLHRLEEPGRGDRVGGRPHPGEQAARARVSRARIHALGTSFAKSGNPFPTASRLGDATTQ